MKVHTIMKYQVGVPMVDRTDLCCQTRSLSSQKGAPAQDATLAMDRAYIDYAQFQRLTEEGVCYVTKMKKNLNYKELSSTAYVSREGLVTHIDKHILFQKEKVRHEARCVELWSNNSRKSVTLLTNNFELSVEELAEIYKRRWAIETLYKQLKQNFPLHFFYGESVNAIQIQTWVGTHRQSPLHSTVPNDQKARFVFQNLTMLRLTLMYYTNFIAFMEDSQKDECTIWAERAKSPPSEPSLFD